MLIIADPLKSAFYKRFETRGGKKITLVKEQKKIIKGTNKHLRVKKQINKLPYDETETGH